MRTTIGSGAPWESRYGYSRAVRINRHVWVAGTTSVVDGEVAHADDAGAQARQSFEIALRAAAEAGLDKSDVVRTRMFVVDLATNGDAVASAHGELFADVQPASTMVGVTALIDPRLLVEVEVELYRDDE